MYTAASLCSNSNNLRICGAKYVSIPNSAQDGGGVDANSGISCSVVCTIQSLQSVHVTVC